MRYLLPWIWLVLGCSVNKPSITKTERTTVFHNLKDEKDLKDLIKAIGNARFILIGEESHGTHEFYAWRSAITKQLIREGECSALTVEGDWEDFRMLNELINHVATDSTTIMQALDKLNRWPAWLWKNNETFELLTWLHNYNLEHKKPVNLYGLDIYSFWKGIQSQIPYSDTSVNRAGLQLLKCFCAFGGDAMKYAKAVETQNANCSQVVLNYVDKMNNKTFNRSFLEDQQAMLALSGEKYFRTLALNKMQAWNIRESYMAETIRHLNDFYQKKGKIIIWVHNSHAGDVDFEERSTPGYKSLCKILREYYGKGQVFSIGFGTYKGNFIGAYLWDDIPRKIKILPARQGSFEYILHEMGSSNKYLLSSELRNNQIFNNWMEFRSVGIVNEGWTIYNRSNMINRFDSFIYIDSTSALQIK